MAKTVGPELPTTQSSNPSPLEAGNGIFDCGDKPSIGAFSQAETTHGDAWGAKSPHSGGINAKWLLKVSTQGLRGGRTRARTWDPMIKSQRNLLIYLGIFQTCINLRNINQWVARKYKPPNARPGLAPAHFTFNQP